MTEKRGEIIEMLREKRGKERDENAEREFLRKQRVIAMLEKETLYEKICYI